MTFINARLFGIIFPPLTPDQVVSLFLLGED